MLVINKVTHW